MSRRFSLFQTLLGVTAVRAATYAFLIRPWHLRWGATDDEVGRCFPGDDLVPTPRLVATHAIAIRAPAARVWPWLAQLGQGRGGFYSYTWIENLMGADIHNADRILPKFQALKIGDVIPFAKGGFGVPVAILEPERARVLHGDTRTAGSGAAPPVKPGEFIAVSWGFHLRAQPDGTTRLLERWKADWTPTLANNVFYRAFLEPGAFIMERAMLSGIKRRAEARPHAEVQTG